MFYSNKEDSEDKYHYTIYDFNLNEFSDSFDQIEHILPIQNEISTGESEKNEIIGNEENQYLNYTIPNEPLSLLDKENNQNIYDKRITKNLNILARNEKLKNIVNKKIINNKNILKKFINKWLTRAMDNSNENLEIYEEEVENSFLNKKRKDKNKYNDTNIRRKTKHLLFDNILNFSNNTIKKVYNNNIRKGILMKQFFPLNTKPKSELNSEYNKELLNKTIKDIFSDVISQKYTNIPKDHNKKLIKDLLNEKDLNIKNYFTNLFSLTFIQCLEHFRGTKFYNELNGMKLLEEEIKNYDNEKEYAENLQYYFNNYEKIINNKKSRNSKKKNDIKK